MNFESPEEHRESIVEEFSAAYREKYNRGQAEHGGNLWRKDNLSFAKEEVLDFASYVFTADWQRRKALRLLELAVQSPETLQYVYEAMSVLRGESGLGT